MLTNSSLAIAASQPVIFPYFREFVKVVKTLEYFWVVIIPFGILSNMNNIIVFVKSGMKDIVTIQLLSLSLSDCCFLALMTPWLATVLILEFAPGWDWKFDARITSFLFYWPAFTLYDFSAYVSVFLGVTRCACVAWPLHFKSVFTRSRTIITIIALFTSTILLRIPVLTIHSVVIKLNPVNNQSFAFLVTNNSPTNVLVNDTLNRTSLPWMAFIIMIVCVLTLSFKLMEASKVRQSSKPKFSSTAAISINGSDVQGEQGNGIKNKMSVKETHVVQSVVLVCVIFILSQLPFLLYSTGRLIHPEFNHDKKFRYLFGICTQISLTCSFFNASVNIFIYYNYNSKYRSAMQSMLCNKVS